MHIDSLPMREMLMTILSIFSHSHAGHASRILCQPIHAGHSWSWSFHDKFLWQTRLGISLRGCCSVQSVPDAVLPNKTGHYKNILVQKWPFLDRYSVTSWESWYSSSLGGSADWSTKMWKSRSPSASFDFHFFQMSRANIYPAMHCERVHSAKRGTRAHCLRGREPLIPFRVDPARIHSTSWVNT